MNGGSDRLDSNLAELRLALAQRGLRASKAPTAEIWAEPINDVGFRQVEHVTWEGGKARQAAPMASDAMVPGMSAGPSHAAAETGSPRSHAVDAPEPAADELAPTGPDRELRSAGSSPPDAIVVGQSDAVPIMEPAVQAGQPESGGTASSRWAWLMRLFGG